MIRHLIANPCLHAALAIVVAAGFCLPCSAGSSELNAAVSSFESSQSAAIEPSSESGRLSFVSGRSMGVPFGNGRFSAAGKDLTKSLALTWGSVWALKLLVDAGRPTGGDHSFPSGPTATAFAMAPVLTEHFGWKVGVPAYTLAAATAFAHLEEREHRTADVLVGAALGFVIGSEITSKGGLGVIREHVVVCGRGLGVKVRF
jgi:hypothetical protein